MEKTTQGSQNKNRIKILKIHLLPHILPNETCGDYEILKMISKLYKKIIKYLWGERKILRVSFYKLQGVKAKLAKKTGLQKTWSPTQTLEEVYFRQETKPALHKSSSGCQLKSRVR